MERAPTRQPNNWQMPVYCLETESAHIWAPRITVSDDACISLYKGSPWLLAKLMLPNIREFLSLLLMLPAFFFPLLPGEVLYHLQIAKLVTRDVNLSARYTASFEAGVCHAFVKIVRS